MGNSLLNPGVARGTMDFGGGLGARQANAGPVGPNPGYSEGDGGPGGRQPNPFVQGFILGYKAGMSGANPMAQSEAPAPPAPTSSISPFLG
jgi:hypothetical protein